MPNPYQEILDDAFDAGTDLNVIRGVSEGVLLADLTLESHPFLRSQVGKDLRGHLRRSAILYRLHGMCAAGDLPFSSTMSKMPKGNWHWVEFRSGNVVAHVCRTDGPDLFPVDTPTRQEDRHTNQGDLFLDKSNVVPLRGLTTWLMFGAGDGGALAHLCWGMPRAKENDWLARTNILRRAAHSESEAKVESPSPSVVLKFKSHIEESLKDKDDKSGDGDLPA